MTFAVFAACVSNVHLRMSDIQFETGHYEVTDGLLLFLTSAHVLRCDDELVKIADF